jgi:hypothetical protein
MAGPRPFRAAHYGIESRQLVRNIKQDLVESGDPAKGGIWHAKVLVNKSKMKPGEHILRGHLRHNRRRITHSDAFSGGARPGGRLTFEGEAEHSTTENKAFVGPCVRVLPLEKVPRPLSTFAERLLSAVSTPWSQKLLAERWSSFRIQYIAHLVLSSFTLYSYGTPFAQAIWCEIWCRDSKGAGHIFNRSPICNPLSLSGRFIG